MQGEEGAEMSYAYDAEGHVTGAEDALGNRVFLEYDKAGQLIKESNTLGNCREYTYTPLGKVESITDEAGRKTSYAYLPGGRLSEVTHSDGTKESYTYDAAGNVKTHRDRNGFTVTYSYDCLGRAVRISGSGGEEKRYAYDAVGNVTCVTDAYGNATRYEYSLTGQLTKVTDALGNETEYRYDVCDRLIEVLRHGDSTVPGAEEDLTRAGGQEGICRVTRYQRNKLGQVESIKDALGNTEHYTYDAKGQLIEKLDKEGYLTKYGYTAQGDVRHIAYADGREVKLSYDSLRQLEEMEDWLGITKIENDALGRALRVQYPDGKEVSYTYGKSGERTGLTYPDGRQVTYSYDDALRLSGLSDGNGTITYGYDGAGRLTRKAFPGGMETTYAYDAAGHLSELIHRDREGILDRYSYRYDLLGNKTAIEKQRRGLPEESGLYAYGYDALGRLSTVAKDGQELRSYGYDVFGNRTLLREGSAETTYTYNAMDQLVSKVDALGEETYAYDKRGNLDRILKNGALKDRYTYGALNRLEQAVRGDGEAASYLYNGLGHRVGKDIGRIENAAGAQRESDKMLQGTGLLDPFSKLERQELCPERKIRYIIDLTKGYHNLLQKEEETAVQTFLWDGNVAGMWEEAGTPVGRPDGSAQGATSRYYLQDELGSPIRLFGEGGGLEESYGYDEFGRDLYGNQGLIQPFGYTGYQADHTAGTYYAQAREYKPELGRFAAVDTVKGFLMAPFTLNEYGYCWNNPKKYVDISGKNPKEMEIVGGEIKDEFEDYNGLVGTLTYGINLSGTLGIFVVDSSIGLSFDYKGNIAVQATGAWGVTASSSPSCAIAGFKTKTNAPDVDYLNEAGGCMGASLVVPVNGVPMYGALDLALVGDLDNKVVDGKNYYGYTASVGVGIPGVEAHGEMSYTITLAKFNIYMWMLEKMFTDENSKCD